MKCPNCEKKLKIITICDCIKEERLCHYCKFSWHICPKNGNIIEVKNHEFPLICGCEDLSDNDF